MVDVTPSSGYVIGGYSIPKSGDTITSPYILCFIGHANPFFFFFVFFLGNRGVWTCTSTKMSFRLSFLCVFVIRYDWSDYKMFEFDLNSTVSKNHHHLSQSGSEPTNQSTQQVMLSKEFCPITKMGWMGGRGREALSQFGYTFYVSFDKPFLWVKIGIWS